MSSSRAAAKVATRAAAKVATRDALIRAGALEFAEQGLDAPSLDSICARAGFTRGAFYVHFRDRDDLLVAVVERVLTRFQEAVLPAGGAPLDLQRTIRGFVAAVAAGERTAVGTPAWRFRHTLGACARVPALGKRYVALQRRAVTRVTAAVAAGQQAGEVRADVGARAIAEILVVLSLGISAASELGMPFELEAGGAALERLFAAPRRPRAGKRLARAADRA